jgi:hypothetical protein
VKILCCGGSQKAKIAANSGGGSMKIMFCSKATNVGQLLVYDANIT